MANTNSPNGFTYSGRQEGGSPTVGYSYRKIAYNDTTAIGFGDPVTALGTGYITSATPGTTQIDGIFYGCEYYATAVSRVVWSNSWPGSGSNSSATILAQLITDPQSTFIAQSNNTAITFADIEANINFVTGTVSSGGFSAAALDQSSIATTNTLPFRIVGLYSGSAPPGTPGTDDASAYNRVIVRANFWDRTSATGIV